MQKEKVLFNATLCFLLEGDHVLLARKTRNIGAGCLNGYGGGIEEGESAEEAIVRELSVESGVIAVPQDLKKVAEVYFHNTKTDGITTVCKCHVYILRRWKGQIKANPDEMVDPTWFALGKLPFGDMMPADPFWVPQILAGGKCIVEVPYGPFQKTLLGPVVVKEVDHF